MLDDFKSHLLSELPFLFKSKIIIATSSGVDSVVLCFLCKRLGLDFSIAHCNFCLRGDESDGDEEFIRSLCDLYKIKLYVKSFDTKTFAKKSKMSIQMAARLLRYDWFQTLKKKYNFCYIAT